jgi:hypothetical protein
MTTLRSTADAQFLNTVEHWLLGQTEILVLIRYSRAAGSKSFEFFTSFAVLEDRLRQLPPETSVTAFRRPQLLLRGVADDQFIARCLSSIPDGVEFLVVETVRRTAGRASWFHEEAGESHGELRQALEASRGNQVAVGEYPNWTDDSDDVASAYIPDANGALRRGVY